MGTTQSVNSFTPSRPAEETTEKLSKWKKRWDDNFIGWHKEEPHTCLVKHGGKIIPSFEDGIKADQTCTSEDNVSNKKPFRVFVPLCGKTVDMAFLAGHNSVSEVVGIDGIGKALTAFAEENPELEIQTNDSTIASATTTEEKKGNVDDVVDRLKGNGIELLRGDLFDLNDQVTNGKFEMILDRASIVAIQPALREQYVEVMGRLIQPGGSILLLTLDRRAGTEEARKSGPPFSVDEEEVQRLYANLDWVQDVKLVEEHDEFQDESMKARMGSQGLESLFELCFIVTAKK